MYEDILDRRASSPPMIYNRSNNGNNDNSENNGNNSDDENNNDRNNDEKISNTALFKQNERENESMKLEYQELQQNNDEKEKDNILKRISA